ncbi:substrate-binding periplasmic protein [Pseudoalteromonas arabiensis]|uniref:substrate-binding periplasmic protein n=1 Tax=Pseudoalteromonas arabiensis TaxID=874454 RepID=UPI000A5BC47A|nr:transporter substrate-binding domain-containing protein [Pseudoalteromonas arabiensis]
MSRTLILLLFLFCFTTESVSQQSHEKQIIVAASSFLPPYIVKQSNSGIQIEILKAALQAQGITELDIHYMSNKRAEQQLLQGKVDIVLNFPPMAIAGIHKSEPLVMYQNVALSLASNEFIIKSIFDLAGKSVLAFQNAVNFIEQPFKSVTENLASYDEVVNQQAQVDHLMKGWVDVIIMDRRVFLFYLEKYKQSNKVLPFVVHPIFKEAPRPAYFSNKALKDSFNLGLDKIIASGEYQAIIRLDGTEYAQLLRPESRK